MKKTLIYLFGVMVSLTACQKDTDVLVPDEPTPATTWYNTVPVGSSSRVLRSEIAPTHPADSFTVFSTGTTGYGGGPIPGLFLSIPQGALTAGGNQPFSGIAYAELALMKSKGDFIKTGMPTTSGNSLLVAGGAVYIKLQDTQGNELSIRPNNTIMVNYEDTPILQEMKVYNGEPVSPEEFNWVRATDTVLNIIYTGTNFYLMNTTQLGWLSSAYKYNNGSAGSLQTKIALELPSYYTNANSIAYISFDNMRSVMALSGDAVTRQFRSGNIPVGQPVTIIVMSKQVNDYFLGFTQTITVEPSQSGYQTVTLSPTISSRTTIETYLSTL